MIPSVVGSKDELDEFFAQVRSCFGYLTDEFGFVLTKEVNPEIFDNRLVQFDSSDVLIRIIRDRGSVLIDLAPPRPIAGPLSPKNAWFGVGSAMALIEQPYGPCDYRVDMSRLGDSVADIARNLRGHVPTIVGMFSGEELGKTLPKLVALEDKPLRP